ncbi:alpha/beta hydrolase [Rhodoferax sp. 4810]|uniref:Alpha/beta hydrolase n=1 Tax=Thiospirillum jenense TaxID=1653858 RepID=A0A839H9U0_9GAMM|nr:alpha/beta hydrolase [Thiospirillum jenense]MBB1073835.1 alpha/beta hydrolase [Rhodoferax jenense]MBB1125210.1 alpha/beta hydrolase [Thiospirillum jenense]
MAAHSPTTLPPALDADSAVFSTLHLNDIRYYVAGPEDAAPLVLIHSINAAPSAFEMKPLFDHYRTTRRVYVPELPGFGGSDRSDRPYTPELYANAIVAFLVNVVKQRADVMAFSLSSEFLARAALVSPEWFNRLVMLSPTGFNRRGLPTGRTGRALHRFFTLPGLGEGLYNLLTVRPSIRYFLRSSYVGEPPAELIDYAYLTAHQPGARHAPYYFLSGQLFTTDVMNLIYAKIEQPVLAIYDRDAHVSFETLPNFLLGHRNWRATRVSPTLGIPQWERPYETISAVDAFWHEMPGSPN